MKPLLHLISFCALSFVFSVETFADDMEKSGSNARARSSVSNTGAQEHAITNESEYAEFVKKREGVTSAGSVKSSQPKNTVSKSSSSQSAKPTAE